NPDVLRTIDGLEAVITWREDCRAMRQALARREGPIIPLHTDTTFTKWLLLERHVCMDTTAAGGNAALLAG
ncbi:MAG: hypothetical protein AAFQ28_13185, partial [Pseudomonadota bacterium]